MAVHANGYAFHNVFAARPALRGLFEHSIGKRADGRAKERAPSNRRSNSHCKEGNEAQQNYERYLKESFQDHLGKRLFDLFDLSNATSVPSTLKRRGQPYFYYFQSQILGNHSLAEREHVTVIVFSREASRFQIPAKC